MSFLSSVLYAMCPYYVSLLCIALYAMCPYYALLYMQCAAFASWNKQNLERMPELHEVRLRLCSRVNCVPEHATA